MKALTLLIDNEYYDVSTFADWHPGGSMLLDCCNTKEDCSHLYHSCHRASSMKRVNALRDQYLIPKQPETTPEKVTIPFEYFCYEELKARVELELSTVWASEKSSKASMRTALITFFLNGLAMYLIFNTVYEYTLCKHVATAIFSIFLCFFQWHGANHGGQFSNNRLNDVMSISAAFYCGLSSTEWRRSHNVNHHSETNTANDHQYNQSPVLRLYDASEHFSYMKYQHYYAWVLYLGVAFKLQTFPNVHDIKSSFERLGFLNFVDVGSFVGQCVFYFVWIGLVGSQVGYVTALANYFQVYMLASVFLTMVLIPNHNLDDCLVENDKDTDKLNWVKHQIETANNFNCDSEVITFLCGGLNYQIEHHLFPAVHWEYYPVVAKVVRSFCVEKGIKYNHHSFLESMRLHYKSLKRLSVPRSTPELH